MAKIISMPPSSKSQFQAMRLPDDQKPAWLKRGICHCGTEGKLFLMEIYALPGSTEEQSFVYVCSECEQEFWNSCESFRRAA